MPSSTLSADTIEYPPAVIDQGLELVPSQQEIVTTQDHERLREEIRVALERVQAVSDRIASIELTQGDTPRLADIKRLNAKLFSEMNALVMSMLQQDAEFAVIQKNVAKVQSTVQAIEKPLAELPPTVLKASPVEQPASEPIDRQEIWMDMKRYRAERPDAQILLSDLREKITRDVEQPLLALQQRQQERKQRQETPESIIASIVDLHTQLGGATFAASVQEKLMRWVTDPKERRIFGHQLAETQFNIVKSKTGDEGLVRSLRLAKEKAASFGVVEQFSNKLSSLVQKSEVQQLERQQKELLASIALAMDNLVAMMEDQNQLPVLEQRKKSLEQAEQTLDIQVEFDKDLADLSSEVQTLDEQVQQAKLEWKNFVLRLPPRARDLLADDMPQELPTGARDFMSALEIQRYQRFVDNYQNALRAFDKAFDELNTLYETGPRGHARLRVSEALQGAEVAVEDDFSAPEEALTPLQTTERAPTTEESEEIDEQPDHELSPEFLELRQQAVARWNEHTRIKLTELIRAAHPDYISTTDESNDLAEFLTSQMPDAGQRTLNLIGRLRVQVDSAENVEEIEAMEAKKEELFTELARILQKEDLRHPELKGAVKKAVLEAGRPVAHTGDTTKPDSGERTVSVDVSEVTQSGDKTIMPDYAVAEKAKQEAEYKNEQFWKNALTLSTLFHDKLGALRHSELLAHAQSWHYLRTLDSLIISGKQVTELTEEDKKSMIKAVIRLHDAFRPNQHFEDSSETYMNDEGTGAFEINALLGDLGLSDQEALALVGETSDDDDLMITPATIEPKTKPAKPKITTAKQAAAAAQRNPRKIPPRSIQSTRRAA